MDFLEEVSQFIFDVVYKGKNFEITKPISVFGPVEKSSDHPKFYCQHSIVKISENIPKKQQKQEKAQQEEQAQAQLQTHPQSLSTSAQTHIFVILIIDEKEVRCIEPFSGKVHWSLELDSIKNYVTLEECVFAIIRGDESYLLYSSEADKIEDCIRQKKQKLHSEKESEDLLSTVESVARKVVANMLSQKQDLEPEKICHGVLVVIEPFLYGCDLDQVTQDVAQVVTRLLKETKV